MGEKKAEGENRAEAQPNPRSAVAQATPLSLLERVRSNDPAAWFRLVALYQPLVKHWCVRGGAGADADDVAQEVFAAAATALATFRRDRPRRHLSRLAARHHAQSTPDAFPPLKGEPLAVGGSDAWRRMQDVADPLGEADPDEPAQLRELYQRALEQVRGEFQENTWQAFW